MAQSSVSDTSILEAALIGLKHRLGQIESMTAEIRRTLGIRATRSTSQETSAVEPVKRTMSPAARNRIAAAQRKRWAAVKSAKESPVKVTPKKRKLSAAARKAISEATKKRWAAFHKAQKRAATQKAPKTAAKKAVRRTSKKAAA